MARIGPAEVRERYGVEPEQVPDFIALRGDPSDKLPGAPGVGPQGAAGLLRQYGTLEEALKAGRLAGACRQAAAVPLDRDHGPQGAAADAARRRRRPGTRPRRWRGNGSSTSSRIASMRWRNTKDRENNQKQNTIPTTPIWGAGGACFKTLPIR